MQTSDTIMIGAGIIGLSIAHRLAKMGIKVTVLEKGKAGMEASWAAAGMLGLQHENEGPGPQFDLCSKSREPYPDFVDQLWEETDIDVEYRTEGTLFIARDEQERWLLEEKHIWQREHGLKVEWHTMDEILKLEPSVSSEFEGGFYLASDHQINNRKLLEALIIAGKRAGVKIIEDTRVVEYVTHDKHVVGVKTQKEQFHSNVVVNAAGSWSGTIPGVSDRFRPRVKPIRGQMLDIQMDTILPLRHIVFSLRGYLVPKQNGTVLAGSTMEDVGFDKSVTAGGVNDILNNALELVPALKSCRLLDSWAGFRPESEDGLPILGKTETDGLIMATGHRRKGILLAPITARLIADLILTGEESPLLSHFRLSRFC